MKILNKTVRINQKASKSDRSFMKTSNKRCLKFVKIFGQYSSKDPRLKDQTINLDNICV